MKILIGIALGFCLTILLFILLANIPSYVGPPFDVDKIDIVNIYEYRSDYEKKNNEISDDQPIYRMVGEEARSFLKEIRPNFKFAEVSYPKLIYSIEIKEEDAYYLGKIYPGLGTIEIDDYCGKLTGKSKEIASSLYTKYRNENGTRLTLIQIQSAVNALESKNKATIDNLIENEYKELKLKVNEKLSLLIKNEIYNNYNEEDFEKYYKKDDWGTPFNVDYTTNLTGLSESLSNSLSKFSIAVWSSGPNGIDERCLGDDIPWPASSEY
ncbi:MAG: hypothetical protein M0Q48_02455 [Verrucomicrobia bacterium]|nr:hypothetical protein [Verrucomicrobiota bacterium]